MGAPVAIDIDDAKVPKITGAPGRTSWQNAMPDSASASAWAASAATVTGDMAPARMNGEITHAWLCCAYTSAAPSMVASQRSGDDALIRLVSTVRLPRSPPKAIRHSSTESPARLAAVTEPISGLSL